jgi:NAD(P)-dependent dehydrogenase (short-subunit alcohol dehydrogenase family)
MTSVFRDHLLKDKVAFLTGGGSGITLSIAERFAAHGAHVMLIGRRQEKLDAAVGGIRAAGGSADSCAVDVRDYEALQEAFRKTRGLWGAIDLLVCGAAGNFPAPVLGMSANGFKSVIDIDLLGTFNTCRGGYEYLRKPGASILNISATHAFTPVPFQAHVCAGKAGIDMLTKVLAVEWGPSGVRVNVISPGPVDDTEGMRRLAPSEEARANVTAKVPLRRFASKDEIAGLALFLSSDAAAYITGSIVVCDGGMCLSGHSLGLA